MYAPPLFIYSFKHLDIYLAAVLLWDLVTPNFVNRLKEENGNLQMFTECWFFDVQVEFNFYYKLSIEFLSLAIVAFEKIYSLFNYIEIGFYHTI